MSKFNIGSELQSNVEKLTLEDQDVDSINISMGVLFCTIKLAEGASFLLNE